MSIRFRRFDAPSEGLIETSEEWKAFLESLPRTASRKKPVAQVTFLADHQFREALHAHDFIEYSWPDIEQWLKRLSTPLIPTGGYTMSTRTHSRI
jgi:hypothetical protein